MVHRTLRLTHLTTDPDPGNWPRARAVTMVLERCAGGILEGATIRASQADGVSLDMILHDLSLSEAALLSESIQEAMQMITQDPFPF